MRFWLLFGVRFSVFWESGKSEMARASYPLRGLVYEHLIGAINMAANAG